MSDILQDIPDDTIGLTVAQGEAVGEWCQKAAAEIERLRASRDDVIREWLVNPSAEMIEAVCAARYFVPEQWPDGCTDGEIAVQRLLAEKQIAAILPLLTNPDRN